MPTPLPCFALLVTLCSPTLSVPLLLEQSALDVMADLLAGTYDNEVQYLDELQHNVTDKHPHAHSRIIRTSVPAVTNTDPIFYIQQFTYDLPTQREVVYRQALYQLTQPADSTMVTLTIWMFNEPERWLDAWNRSDPFQNLTLKDAFFTPQCRVYWEEVGEKLFHSHMTQNCIYNSSSGPVRITDENWLSPDYLTIHEQWFTLDGKKIWGHKTCMNQTRQAERVAPVWPNQWHANVMITGTAETSEVEVDVTSTGGFFYDWDPTNSSGKTAMFMKNITDGKVTRDVNLYGVFYYINDTSGACFHFKIPGVRGPAAPTWIKENFAFNETQYLTKQEGTASARWSSAGHWQYDAFGGGPEHLFNYWHEEDVAMTPSRIMGPSLTSPPYGHSFIEVDGFHVGFDDVPKAASFFDVPKSCAAVDTAHLVAAAAGDDGALETLLEGAAKRMSPVDQQHLASLIDRVASTGQLSPLTLVSERLIDDDDNDENNAIQTALAKIIARRATAPRPTPQRHDTDAFPLWPEQFYANHTGNGITWSGDAPMSQRGTFYYDATRSRSVTLYIDVATGQQERQIFEGGWVYRVNETTGTCVAGRIPAAFGMTGPVRPDFLRYFVRQKDQYMLRNHTATKASDVGLGSIVYSRCSHWTFWAFAADPAHAFHVWQRESTGQPFQVLGPGPATPPFGLAFLGYENVTVGFSGVDVNAVFHIPDSCKHAN